MDLFIVVNPPNTSFFFACTCGFERALLFDREENKADKYTNNRAIFVQPKKKNQVQGFFWFSIQTEKIEDNTVKVYSREQRLYVVINSLFILISLVKMTKTINYNNTKNLCMICQKYHHIFVGNYFKKGKKLLNFFS